MKPELLAPAGDLQRLKIALLYGADAVYIGGSLFGLRANATNFTIEEIKEGVSYAHSLNKKVYVTVNIVLHNKEIKHLLNYLKQLEEVKVDAIIVSDPAIMDMALKNTNLEVHLSTQQSTLNYEAVDFFKKQGVSRVVLARESSKEDIKKIKENVNIELEVFIHGAMCTSYSGRCVLSNYFTNRDSNRGGCSQVCRFIFDNGTDEDFMIASKDLNMIDYISDLMDIGVESYKIEGRMKSLYYIATVSNAYRTIMDKKIDGTLKDEDIEYYKKILNRVSNRENIPQFYDKIPGVEGQYYTGRNEVSNKDFLGLVLDYNENTKEATIEQRNKFSVGDTVEVFGPNTSVQKLNIEYIINSAKESTESAPHPGEIVKIKIPFNVQKNDILRVVIS